MRLVRALAAVTMLVMLTQSAAAQTPFSTASLLVRGDALLEGGASALFLVAPADGTFTWEAVAGHVLVEREWMSWDEVRNPATGTVVFSESDPRVQRERLEFTDARLASQGAEPLQALLARGDVRASGASLDEMRLEPLDHPRLDQVPPPEVESREGAADGRWEIHETVPGEHLAARAGAATYELRGTFTLLLVGPDYALRAADGAHDGRTGVREVENRGGAVVRGEKERQTLTLTDAVLRVEAPAGGLLLAKTPTLSFTGAVVAAEPDGPFPLPIAPGADGRSWAGQGALDLDLVDGRIGASASPIQTAGAAHVARAPPLLAYAAGVLALLAAAGVAVAGVLLLRRRAAEEDPLALALLAMEDRRWDDALPHLEKALAKSPDDAKLLLDRALCLEEAGRLGEARDGYERALRAEPFNAETHYYYARALARLQNPTSSLAHLARALTLDARLAELARQEAAFARFRDHPQFLGLVE